MAKLRVSCMALCRIRHDGRYLFLLNAARMRAGRYSVTPLCGGIAYTDSSILTAIDAEPEKPQSRDLRFYINRQLDGSRLSAFRAWFVRRTGRELDPFRELYEELVVEQKILSHLNRDDVNIHLDYTMEERLNSDRPVARVAETHYFREIFDVTITNSDILRRLLASDRQNGLFWLTREQAKDGKPIEWSGRQIAVQLGYLLRDE